jgi:hypothetical protein
MDMQAAKFLGNDPAPYAAALKFITDRGNVTEADIKSFVAQGIAEAVNAEFGKVSFVLNVKGKASYDAELAYNPETRGYTLSYKRPSENDDKKLSASSLDALLSAISRSSDFDQSSAGLVREKFAQIPAVSHFGRKTTEPTALITEILNGFYTAQTLPDKERYYKALLGMYLRYFSLNVRAPAISSLLQTVELLSPDLARKFDDDNYRIEAINPQRDNSDDIDALAGLISLRY